MPASLSSYKSHTTMKGLLAVAPNGAIIFVSTLFTGSISDRQLTIQSGFLEMLKSVPHERSMMANKGFDIQDLLVKHGLLYTFLLLMDLQLYSFLMYRRRKPLQECVYMWNVSSAK